MHWAAPASSATNQLHRHDRFEHETHVRPSISTPVEVASPMVSDGGWKPTASPQPAHSSDSRTVIPRHLGQRSIFTTAT
jgi:hypothetical protein